MTAAELQAAIKAKRAELEDARDLEEYARRAIRKAERAKETALNLWGKLNRDAACIHWELDQLEAQYKTPSLFP